MPWCKSRSVNRVKGSCMLQTWIAMPSQQRRWLLISELIERFQLPCSGNHSPVASLNYWSINQSASKMASDRPYFSPNYSRWAFRVDGLNVHLCISAFVQCEPPQHNRESCNLSEMKWRGGLTAWHGMASLLAWRQSSSLLGRVAPIRRHYSSSTSCHDCFSLCFFFFPLFHKAFLSVRCTIVHA